MMRLRIGQGFDAHRLVAGRPLILGGVKIEWGMGLLGHSDADVLLHAIMDALLGAAGLGDIGAHFPDSDPAYRDADSSGLLKIAGRMLAQAGYAVANIDATLVAQAPKLSPYREEMRGNIAAALGIAVGNVNIKFSTEEGMGYTGAGEGMCAHAVCLITDK